MKAPSNELKGLVNQAASVEDKGLVVLEWLRLFLELPIAKVWPEGELGEGSKPDLYSDSPLVRRSFEGFSHGSLGDEKILAQFFVNAYLGSLVVQVLYDGRAVIEDGVMPFVGDELIQPEFLEGTDILGFKGSWEQVLRKLIELNDLVAKQTPEVPADLKRP